MTYGLDPQLFIENGPVVQAARRSNSSYAAWRSLDENRRLALVEEALAGPANDDWRSQPVRGTGENDNADGYPVAL